MASAPVAPRQQSVRNFPDERLDKAVLASLGRPGVAVLDQDLTPNQVAQARLQLRRRDTVDAGKRGD